LLEDLRAPTQNEPESAKGEHAPGALAHLPLAQQREVYTCQLAAAVETREALDKCLVDATAANVPKRSLLPFAWLRARASGDSAGVVQAEQAAKEAGFTVEQLATLAVGASPAGAGEIAAAHAPQKLVEVAAPTQLTPAIPSEQPAVAKTSRIDEGVAGGALALGAAALVWLVVERSRRTKVSESAQQAK
jgi:hypothetical protein